eukprot:TRINITY_DN2268_c0_g1_i1.p1 TRINITY_DN2268_c0_g1~~TRINITY_DN2268_c0_g1_i1.p1  ORF type:complete len:759 (-),score=212.52 TRINITY_DN2268_c0_g1_i1:1546-3822(-)
MRNLVNEFNFNSKDWNLVPIGVRNTIEKIIKEMSSVDSQIVEYKNTQNIPVPSTQNLAKMLGQSLNYISLLTNSLLTRINAIQQFLSAKIESVVQHIADDDLDLKRALCVLEENFNSELIDIKDILLNMSMIKEGKYDVSQLQRAGPLKLPAKQSKNLELKRSPTTFDNIPFKIAALPSPRTVNGIKDSEMTFFNTFSSKLTASPKILRNNNSSSQNIFNNSCVSGKENAEIHLSCDIDLHLSKLLEQLTELQVKSRYTFDKSNDNRLKLCSVDQSLADLCDTTNFLQNESKNFTQSMVSLNDTIPKMQTKLDGLQTTVTRVTNFVSEKNQMINENLRRFGSLYDSKLQKITLNMKNVYKNFDELLDNLYFKILSDLHQLNVDGLKRTVQTAQNTTKNLNIQINTHFIHRDKIIDDMGMRLKVVEHELSRLNNDLQGLVFETNTELKQIFTSRISGLDRRLKNLENETDENMKTLKVTANEHSDSINILKHQTIELEATDGEINKRLGTLEKFSKKLSDGIDEDRFHSEQNENRLLQVETSLSSYSININRLNQSMKSQLQLMNRDFDQIRIEFTNSQSDLKRSVGKFEKELTELSNSVRPVSKSRISNIEKKLDIESKLRVDLSDVIDDELIQLQSNVSSMVKTIKSNNNKKKDIFLDSDMPQPNFENLKNDFNVPKIKTMNSEHIPPPPKEQDTVNSPRDSQRLKKLKKIRITSENRDIDFRSIDGKQLFIKQDMLSSPDIKLQQVLTTQSILTPQ